MSTRSKKKLIAMPQIMLPEETVRDMWEEISNAIVLIQEQRACRGMSFQELYEKVNQLITAQKLQFMYTSLTEVIQTHLLLVHHQLKNVDHDGLLQAVLDAYEAHTLAMLKIRDLLMIMDSKRDSTRQPLLNLGTTLFNEKVVQAAPLPQLILEGMLRLIAGSRGGETVTAHLLRSVTTMLIEVGSSNAGHDRGVVYKAIFLDGFLERTRDYYRDQSQKQQQELDVGSYLRWAHDKIEEERKLVETSLDAELTLQPLLQLLRAELLETYRADIVAALSIREMVDAGNLDVLVLALKLFKHVEGGLKAVGDRVRQYISDTCAASIQAEDVREGAKSAIKLIGLFCDLVGLFYSMLTDKLECDSDFTHTLNTAFSAVINTHKRISEYLSIYIDHVIRVHVKEKSSDNVEQVFDRAIRLFRLLTEKDVFERYYKQHLARRLLMVKSSSDEAERMVISRLKAECGNQFTNRFEAMFKDIQISDDNMRDFKKEFVNDHKLLGDVRVLTTVMWPTQQSLSCELPRDLRDATGAYEAWYLAKHTGRKLTWQTALGTMLLQARFPKGSKLLSVSTLQGIILLLFNDVGGSLSVADLEAKTGLELTALSRSLQSLALGKHKVLIKSGADEDELTKATTFEMNNSFTSKMTKIKIVQGVVKETAPERQVTQDRMDEDRRLLMEASIVRVMKHRRNLGHNDLVIEVTKMLSARFVPTPQGLKKRIERLIEADFLRRSATDTSVYEYVA
eukprot:m.195079 g.195079  ORF g.195079 m.195079 type:complete len:737 (-) comp15223_c0_seq2:854-3064(-)